MLNPNSAAFPSFENSEWGLTKREYLAAMALQGLLAAHAGSEPLPSEDSAAWQAVVYADALIEALNAIEE